MPTENKGATAILAVGLCLVIAFGTAAPAAAVTSTTQNDAGDPEPCVRVDEDDPSVYVHEECPDDDGIVREP